MQVTNILNHLEKLIELKSISDEGSFRRAAAKLNIAQSSLSVKMKILENQLDTQLLERSRQGIILTKDGQKVLDFIEGVISKAEELKINLDQSQGKIKGHISVGIYDSIARYIWPPFYKQIIKNEPDISISLFTGRSQSVIDQLERNKVDLAITVEPTSSFTTDIEDLYKDSFSFYCGKKFANSNGLISRKNSVFQLPKHSPNLLTFIIFPDALGLRNIPIESMFKKNKIENFILHRVENFEIALSFCIDNIGISLLPQNVAKSALNKDLLCKVKIDRVNPLDFGEHTIGISTLKAHQNKPIIGHVKNEIKNYIKSLETTVF